MQKYVKRIGDERLTRVPADLDTKPYRDGHDDDLFRRMLDAIDKGHVPAGFRGSQLRDAAREIHGYVRRHTTRGARRTAALEQAMKSVLPAAGHPHDACRPPFGCDRGCCGT